MNDATECHFGAIYAEWWRLSYGFNEIVENKHQNDTRISFFAESRIVLLINN